LKDAVKPLTVHGSRTGFWQAIGTAQFLGKVYHTAISATRDGSVNLEMSLGVGSASLPLKDEIFQQMVRKYAPADDRLRRVQKSLQEKPKDEAALEELPSAYSQAKRWHEAAKAQQEWIDYVKATPEADPRRSRLASEYLSLSWYQLMDRDFQGVLASTDTGKHYDPENLPLDTNRAHALMFLGRTDEADKLYASHHGKKIGEQTWEEVILDDFKALEAEGLLVMSEARRIRAAMTEAQQRNQPPASSGNDSQ